MKSPHDSGAIRGFDDGGPNDRHSINSESPSQPFTVTCEDFRAFSKSTLRGFATLAVNPPGISIFNCSVHVKGDRRWINLPSKQYIGEGVVRWQNLVTLDAGKPYWEFQQLACEAVDVFLESAGLNLLEPATAEEGNGHDLPF